jgi:predicted dithiol-disulfide oxidoreductase (DUF899 family)
MGLPKIVSPNEWLSARKELLAKEKAFSRARDELAAERRKLPMVKLTKEYVFEAPEGKTNLRDLFGKRRQLIVYHLMFDPKWEAACKSCSFIADNFQASPVHLGARDTALVAVSRAPLAKIEAFKKRMAWTHRWLSSENSDFNYDFGVSFREDEKGGYNYGDENYGGESPGCSVFLKAGSDVFHTYSTYARGLDMLITTYHYLDLTPLGRQEEGLKHGMMWVRLHDQYEA